MNSKIKQIILNAATEQDIQAAKNWQFIGTSNHSDLDIDKYIQDNCEFSREIEQLKDQYDLTYCEISEILTKENKMNEFDEYYEQAEDWYNSTDKKSMIEWADSVDLDVGQNNNQLNDDWNSGIIEARAEYLRNKR